MVLGGIEATARLHADTKARPGELSTFMVDMSKVCLFDPAERTPDRVMLAATDVLIVGSGIGGATLAAGLAGSGAKVTILERGEQLPDGPAARDARAIFVDQHYRPKEIWRDGQVRPFNPGNYYYVGGNSKFYGAVMLRYRERGLRRARARGGRLACLAVSLRRPWSPGTAGRSVCSRFGEPRARTRPSRRARNPIRFAPVPDEPAIAAVRERLAGRGCILSRCRSPSTSNAG